MDLKDLDKATKLRVSLVETERALATIRAPKAAVAIHIASLGDEVVILKATPGALIPMIVGNLEKDREAIRSDLAALGFTL